MLPVISEVIDVSKFLISKGYEIYADTYINTIFVKKEWFNKIK